MSVENIVGRRAEKSVLDLASRSPEPEFVAVYGRRRVGKTHLVREYFEEKICFEIVGAHGVTLREQLDNFAGSLGRSLDIGIQPQRPASWPEAFRQLEHFLETLAKGGRTDKRIVFFDELPWLNTPRSRFLPSLEHFWNRWASKQRDLILVVCGSAASWMIQNIVRAKGGLHNRLTRQIRLLPFTLQETDAFLQHKGVSLTRFQTAQLYMAMGGIPHYLRQAEPGLSADQIIDKTCFSSQGLLREEFDKLFSSLFDDSAQHLAIIRTLAKKRSGLTRGEILASMGLQSGGSATRRLEELEESAFIVSQIPFGKNTNDALYRLSDEFTLFYLSWIAKLGKRSPGEGYWSSRQDDSRKRAWTGFAFESLCLKHTPQLKAALGISGVQTTQGPWRHQPPSRSGLPGAEIDLLIDRRDHTINIVEMKFSQMEFNINRRYAEDLRRKINVFKQVTGTRKNVFLAFMTTFGITDNAYSRELVANTIELEDLFQP